MTRSRRAALALPTVLVALLLAGCGGGDDDSPVEDVEVESTPDAGEAVSTDLVSFELPEGWAVLDSEQAREKAGSDANPMLGELADRMGMSEDQLSAQMEAIELFAAAPGGAVDGFLTNVNVIEQPSPPGGVPEGDGMRMELMTFADEVGDIEPIDADGIEGVRAEYSFATGDLSLHGVQLYVEAGDEIAIITVSATEADDADEVAEAIEDSLALS